MNDGEPVRAEATDGGQATTEGGADDRRTGAQPDVASTGVRDEVLLAAVAHFSCLVVSIVGPVVVLLLNKTGSPFVQRHAKEAINVQVNLLVVAAVSFLLMIVGIGICGMFAVGIAAVVMPVVGGVKALNGEDYRFPLIIRVI